MTSFFVGEAVLVGVSVVGLWPNTHAYKTFTHSFTNTHFLAEARGALYFFL